MSVDYEPTECVDDPSRWPFDHARARARQAAVAFPIPPRRDGDPTRHRRTTSTAAVRQWRARRRQILNEGEHNATR